MEREEITSAIEVGAGKALRVSLERLDEISGYVRSISLHSGNRVQVAFEVENLDEGGAYFWATYPTLDAALHALEVFLNKPVQDWMPSHLERPSGPRAAPDHEALAVSIRKRSIRFPPGAQFTLDDSYWSQFLSSE
jgi:hypothetical protein